MTKSTTRPPIPIIASKMMLHIGTFPPCVSAYKANAVIYMNASDPRMSKCCGFIGGPGGNRTRDLLIANEAFYH